MAYWLTRWIAAQEVWVQALDEVTAVGKTLYYNIISLHAAVQIGIGEFNAGERGTLGRSSVPSGGLGEG